MPEPEPEPVQQDADDVPATLRPAIEAMLTNCSKVPAVRIACPHLPRDVQPPASGTLPSKLATGTGRATPWGVPSWARHFRITARPNTTYLKST